MKRRPNKWASIMMVAAIVMLISCKEDEKPKLIPEVTTAAITDVTTTTAKGGGTIVSDGNAAISASGLVYSKTNNTPTVSDSKIDGTVATGSFTSDLTGLTSGSQYFVRAYATNSVGTGYGDVITFNTGNAGPAASNIVISGTVQVPETIAATYTYGDAENDPESGTTIKWYLANDAAGTAEAVIAGATNLTYQIKPTDEFKFIRVGITTRASSGTTEGAEVKSTFVGPVAAEPITVTFTYNGQQVTYGIIISSVTGRRWLDRNLGAPNAPISETDFANYGDLFQWGRAADGHQVTVRGSTSATTSGVATTTTLSSTDTPGNALFIIPGGAPSDWRSPQNDNLWQGVAGINNPCPSGWRIPTTAEWQAENIGLIDDAYAKLKLTTTGVRNTAGQFVGMNGTSVARHGSYWSSTKSTTVPTSSDVFRFRPIASTNPVENTRAEADACRCIKN